MKMQKRFFAWIVLLLAVVMVVLLAGNACRYTGTSVLGESMGRKGFSQEAMEVPSHAQSESDGKPLPSREEPFYRERDTAPPISCLYFDEASFMNAVSAAVVFEQDIKGLNGGIVPHHLLAGSMIASFWNTISQQDYDLVVVIGPDHYRKSKSLFTTASSGFSTIYGDVTAPTGLIDTLIQENLVSEDLKVMETDHAISSHMPFVRYYMPDTQVLPLLVNGGCSAKKAEGLADRILKMTQGMKVLFVASMDFSHYLPLEEANQKDEYTEKVLADFDTAKIMEMTNDNLDSRPSALYLLHTMSALGSKTMRKWDHSNSDIISKQSTGYTTSYFLFGFFSELDQPKLNTGASVEDATTTTNVRIRDAHLQRWGPQELDEVEKVQTEPANKINIIAAGDIMLGRGVSDSLKAQGLGYSYPFLAVKELLDEGDIVFGNLEQPLTDRKESLDPKHKYILKSETEAVSGLAFAGFNVLSLANNHIMDYYENGLMDTLETLDTKNIAHAGAGQNLSAAREAVVLEKNGIKVGILAYTDMAEVTYKGNPPLKYAAEVDTSGVAPLRPEVIEKDIQLAREKVDILIVSLHWGIEDSYQVTDEQIDLAHKICDWGADLLLGHHPHRFQGIELYEGKPIVYSMGNFIFDQIPENQESFIMNFTYEGSELTGIRAIPVRTVNHNQVLPLTAPQAKEMLERELRLSQELGTECSIEGNSVSVIVDGDDPF